MTLRLRYLTWKIRVLCWVLRRLRAGHGGAVAPIEDRAH
jgi:hypothetical protein